MKNIFGLVILAFFTTCPVMADNVEERPLRPKSGHDTKITNGLRATVTKLNQQLSKDSPKLRLFAQLADKEKSEKEGYLVPSHNIVKVANSENWPELTVTSFIVLMRNNETIAAFQEVPVSESGDWFNTYTHYYDEKGNTVAFQRYSGFFNGCPSSPAKETSTYYYQDHRLIAKDYSLLDENDKKLEPSVCEFPYRHDYTIRKTWVGSRKTSGVGQAW